MGVISFSALVMLDSLMTLNSIYMLITPTFISTATPLLLNFRHIHPSAHISPPLGCLTGISKSTSPKPAAPEVFLISVNVSYIFPAGALWSLLWPTLARLLFLASGSVCSVPSTWNVLSLDIHVACSLPYLFQVFALMFPSQVKPSLITPV